MTLNERPSAHSTTTDRQLPTSTSAVAAAETRRCPSGLGKRIAVVISMVPHRGLRPRAEARGLPDRPRADQEQDDEQAEEGHHRQPLAHRDVEPEAAGAFPVPGLPQED